MTTTVYEVWEFYGRGDAFFGGSADDRVLYRLADGTAAFLRGWEARGLAPVRVDTMAEAVALGRHHARPGALVSPLKLQLAA
jgi:hypothetical protein